MTFGVNPFFPPRYCKLRKTSVGATDRRDTTASLVRTDSRHSADRPGFFTKCISVHQRCPSSLGRPYLIYLCLSSSTVCKQTVHLSPLSATCLPSLDVVQRPENYNYTVLPVHAKITVLLLCVIVAKDKTGTELYINSEKDANMETRRNDGNME